MIWKRKREPPQVKYVEMQENDTVWVPYGHQAFIVGHEPLSSALLLPWLNKELWNELDSTVQNVISKSLKAFVKKHKNDGPWKAIEKPLLEFLSDD